MRGLEHAVEGRVLDPAPDPASVALDLGGEMGTLEPQRSARVELEARLRLTVGVVERVAAEIVVRGSVERQVGAGTRAASARINSSAWSVE